MRAGGYTVHQSLTAEAAAVLKLALGLARRRGHAQVTPLHVAFTLLGSSTSSPLVTFAAPRAAAATPSSCAYGLLRRACAKAHPAAAAAAASGCAPAAASHPAQCRALELCFNVALNRLPTVNAVVGSPLSSPSSSSSSSTSFAASLLQQTNPTLSNALVAALKRAQANQRRGCVELQSQQPLPPPPSPQQQQQQPLLTIKVELDQLIISILDDPSVSRVMREAGFSSAAVKTSLEEQSAMLLALGHHDSSSTLSAAAVPPQFFLDPYSGFPTDAGGFGGGSSWPARFVNHQPDVEFESPYNEEDVRAIVEVMSRKQGRRTNPVVVGDTVSIAEASVAELIRRLGRGDVPDELRGTRLLRLHLSHVHVRFMTRADVEAWAADLRRSVAGAGANTKAGLVMCVGDMRWAVDDDDDEGVRAQLAAGFSPAAHLAAELARLLAELRAASRGHAWLVAAASYGTYMRCQRSSLEATWALQPVAVPAGTGLGLALGLALGPRAASATDGKITGPARFPPLGSAPKEDDGVPALCAECAQNYEAEASAVRAKAEGTTLALTYFPGWPRADEPQASHEDDLMELKRKWTRLCRRAHLQRQCSQPARPPSPALCSSFETPPPPSCQGASDVTTQHQEVKATLRLLPGSAEEVHHRHGSEGTGARPAAQEAGAAVESGDRGGGTPRLWLDERRSSDHKRKAERGRLPGESKRWRDGGGGGGGGLDLNLCASDEEDSGHGGVASEDEHVPSDLTNDGESSGDVTDTLDSHN